MAQLPCKAPCTWLSSQDTGHKGHSGICQGLCPVGITACKITDVSHRDQRLLSPHLHYRYGSLWGLRNWVWLKVKGGKWRDELLSQPSGNRAQQGEEAPYKESSSPVWTCGSCDNTLEYSAQWLKILSRQSTGTGPHSAGLAGVICQYCTPRRIWLWWHTSSFTLWKLGRASIV